MDQRTPNEIREHPSPAPEVMIFGSGACARKIAANLVDGGVVAWLAAGDEAVPPTDSRSAVHGLGGAELIHCRGFAGDFELLLDRSQTRLHKQVPAIVVALDDRRLPNYAPYGVKPGPRVMTISALEEKLQQASTEQPFGNGARIALLCGWQDDSHPAISRRMVDACLQLQQRVGVKTYFMTGNLKVAATGTEAMVTAAKRAGAVFLKFSHDFPAIQVMADDRFAIDYIDELTRLPFQLEADWLVVDETVAPDAGLEALAAKLGIDCDGLGFAQSDNVRRLSNATNRQGVFVAGGSRGILSAEEQMADADQVSLKVLGFLRNPPDEALPTVTIEPGRCVRCLTCYRLCPHGAIDIGSHMSVVTAACQSCGICVAGCPARAIEMEGVYVDAEISRRLQPSAIAANTAEANPPILFFGCARSAGQALALARRTGHVLPGGVQFVEVPCGGTLDTRHVLAAFEAGAGGVMICTCHGDNCQSQIGNRIAGKRADAVRDLLSAAGVESQRLHVASVAANMGNELTGMIRAFADRIMQLPTQP